MTAPAPRLDPFETALLRELRTVVAERSAQPLPRGRRWSRPLLLGAAAAVGLGALTLLPGPTGNPAYSVQEGNAGSITVEVHRLDDAAGLERLLAEHGVTSDVTFLPDLKQCGGSRGQSAPGRDLRLTVGRDLFSVTLGPGAVRDGETLVLSASVVPLEPGGASSVVSADVVTGPVAACRPEPARPAPPRP